MSDFVRPQSWQPTGLPRPWDSPGKNTGVGCHFLLQCMKVKSESEVSQSCSTPSDLMDCSPPGSPVHGICQARVLEWCHCLFPDQASNSGPLHWECGVLATGLPVCNTCVHAQSCLILCDLMNYSPSGPSGPWDSLSKNSEVGCHFLLQGIFPTQGLNPCLLYLLPCRWILYH